MNFGLFGRLFRDDPGYRASANASIPFDLGQDPNGIERSSIPVPAPAADMNGGLGPLSGSQKTALLFAGLRDALGSFRGQPTNNFDNQAVQFQSRNDAASRNSAMQEFLSATTPEAKQLAAQKLLMLGVDLGPAIRIGQPSLEHVGNDLVSVPNFGGNPTKIYSGPPQPPAGYEWAPDGKTLVAIPGGPADRAAAGRRKPLAAQTPAKPDLLGLRR